MPMSLEILRVLTQSRITKRATVTLPQSLQDDIPKCAQECLSTSIDQTFVPSACSNATDLGCLCSHYNSQGLTLGEASLVCLNAGCPQSALNATSSSNIYGICSGQSKAVTPTHSVLTSFQTATAQGSTITALPETSHVSVTASPSASLSSSTSSQASSSAISTFSTSIIPSVTSITSAAASDATISTSSNATAPTVPANHQTSTLTNAQAIGVCVGAFGGLGVLIAFIFCCICIRRKKQTKQKQKKAHRSFDFVDKSPGLYPPNHHHIYLVQNKPHTVERLQVPAPSRQRQRPTVSPAPSSGNVRDAIPPSLRVQEREESTGRPITQWPKPVFIKSDNTRTNTKQRPPRPPRPESSATNITVFDEDTRSPYNKRLPSIHASPFQPYRPAVKQGGVQPRFAEQYTQSPEEVHHPSHSLEIPPMPTFHDCEGRLPSPTELTPDSPLRSGRPEPPHSAMSYLPAYYTSNDSRTPVVPHKSPHRFSFPQQPMPKVPTTKTPHMSYASDTTTFDSIDPDDVTPPEESDKRLSAVAESPLSSLKYPKIPRPSNQAIPRSPPQSRWTASTSAFSPASDDKQPATQIRFSPSSEEKHPRTLLSKRRGENAAQDLEQSLHISSPGGSSSTYSRHSIVHGLRIDGAGSPMKVSNYSRGGYHELPEMALKSPLWEPELTPSKRGDDLFISVH